MRHRVLACPRGDQDEQDQSQSFNECPTLSRDFTAAGLPQDGIRRQRQALCRMPFARALRERGALARAIDRPLSNNVSVPSDPCRSAARERGPKIEDCKMSLGFVLRAMKTKRR